MEPWIVELAQKIQKESLASISPITVNRLAAILEEELKKVGSPASVDERVWAPDDTYLVIEKQVDSDKFKRRDHVRVIVLPDPVPTDPMDGSPIRLY